MNRSYSRGATKANMNRSLLQQHSLVKRSSSNRTDVHFPSVIRWGGQGPEAEDRDDLSESEDEEETRPNKCCLMTRAFFKAMFPNKYPFVWLLIPFLVCAVLLTLAYGNGFESSKQGYTIMKTFQSWDSSPDSQPPSAVVRNLNARELALQGCMLLAYISLLNAALWLIFMAFRGLVIVGVVNLTHIGQHSFSCFFTTIDPELIYVIWSAFVYGMWKSSFNSSEYYAVHLEDPNKKENMYYSTILGEELLVQEYIVEATLVLSLSTIVLAVRRLLFSVMVFVFEMGFFTNMNGPLVNYLTKYSLIRKFNIRWAEYQMCKDDVSQASDGESQCDGDSPTREANDQTKVIKRTISANSCGSRFSRVSRVSRPTKCDSKGPSLKRRMSLVAINHNMPVDKYRERLHQNAQKDAGLALHDNRDFFRFGRKFSQNIIRGELNGQAMPKQLTRKSIEKSSESKTHNWLLIKYMVTFPPAIFYDGQRIEIESKATARSVAEILFLSLLADARELTTTDCNKDCTARQHHTVGGEATASHRSERERNCHSQVASQGQKDAAISDGESSFDGTFPADSKRHSSDGKSASALPTSAVQAPIRHGQQTNVTLGGVEAGAVLDSALTPSNLTGKDSKDVTFDLKTCEGATKIDHLGGTTVSTVVPEAGEKELNGGNICHSTMLTVPPVDATSVMHSSTPDYFDAALRSVSPQQEENSYASSNVAMDNTGGSGFRQSNTLSGRSEAAKLRVDGQRIDDDECNFEPLDGSFDFSVVDPRTARMARRAPTQHITTHTPFAIAIRAPSVDGELSSRTTRFSPDPQQRMPAPDFEPSFQDGNVEYSEGFRRNVETVPSKRLEKGNSTGPVFPIGHRVRLALGNFLPRSRSSLVKETAHEKCATYAVSLVKDDDFESERSYTGNIGCGHGRQYDFKGKCPKSVPQQVQVSPLIKADGRSFSEASSVIFVSEYDSIEQGHRHYHLMSSATAASPSTVLDSCPETTGHQAMQPKPATGITGETCVGPGNIGGSEAGTGGRKLLSPHDAGDDDCRARNRHPVSTLAGEQYFTREFVEFFLKPDEADEFMKQVDLGGHGKINLTMFKRALISVYKMRKSLLKALKNQESICKTVRRMISLLLWAAAFVALLLVLGVNLNTVIVSGAASISALIVALMPWGGGAREFGRWSRPFGGYIYQHFITAVIFVAFTNPYNVGDRIRIDGGDAMYVRRIRTYTTDFETIFGKPIVYSNSVLFNLQLTNESRSKHATVELKFRVDIRTPVQMLKILERGMKQAMEAKPMDFVKDSFSIYICEVQPGRWMDISIYFTSVEGWGNFKKVFGIRTYMYMTLQKLCSQLGITYQEPLLPVHVTSSCATTQSSALTLQTDPSAQFHQTTMHSAEPSYPSKRTGHQQAGKGRSTKRERRVRWSSGTIPLIDESTVHEGCSAGAHLDTSLDELPKGTLPNTIQVWRQPKPLREQLGLITEDSAASLPEFNFASATFAAKGEHCTERVEQVLDGGAKLRSFPRSSNVKEEFVLWGYACDFCSRLGVCGSEGPVISLMRQTPKTQGMKREQKKTRLIVRWRGLCSFPVPYFNVYRKNQSA